MHITKLAKFVVIALGTFSPVCASRATQIAYEGFDYPVGSTFSNQNGGTGWMGAWTGANVGGGGNESSQLPFVITNGYSWSNSTGGYIVGTGGAIFDHDSSPHGNFRQWFDPLNDLTTTWGTNLWFSFIATYDVASGSAASVNLFEYAADSVQGFGIACTGPNGNGDFVAQIRAAGAVASSGVANIQSSQPGTNLVIGRFQLGPSGIPYPYPGYQTGDRLDVWLNQTTEPTNGSSLFLTNFSVCRAFPYSTGQLGIRTGGACQMTIDELRIGNTFTDVVPATAKSPNPRPSARLLSLENAGPMGLQFNTAEATATNTCEVQTFNGGGYFIPDCAWVGNCPARYTFTIAKPPAPGPSNFMAFAWLIANPNGFIQATLSNEKVVQLALISDGHGNAHATLGYRVSGLDNSTFFTSGKLCEILGAPFAGRWTITVTNDRFFTLTAPNNAQASGAMASGDEQNFASHVPFYLGVSPNGGSNVGNPCLGWYMTVSDASLNITTNGTNYVLLETDWSTGAPLTADPRWQILADFPSCIYVMPSNSVYRATWLNASGPGVGVNSLDHTDTLGGTGTWTSLPSSSVLSDGTNVTFVTKEYVTNAAGFFRVRIPFSP